MQKLERKIFSNRQGGNRSLHKTSSDSGIRGGNRTTLKYLVIMSTIFPHCRIHKYTWTSLVRETHKHSDCMLTDRW
jgi:hypothetical protein